MKYMKLNLVISLLVVVMELIGTSLSFQTNGFGMFQFYTVDSNLFAMVAFGIYSYYLVKSMRQGEVVIPAWAQMIRYMSVCCLTVTFVVVVTVLAPMVGPSGYLLLLTSNSMLYHHLLCPLVTLFAFLFLDQVTLRKGAAFIALIPTLGYGGIAILLNLLRVMDGPYAFLRVYRQSPFASVIWALVLFAGGFLFAAGILGLYRVKIRFLRVENKEA